MSLINWKHSSLFKMRSINKNILKPTEQFSVIVSNNIFYNGTIIVHLQENSLWVNTMTTRNMDRRFQNNLFYRNLTILSKCQSVVQQPLFYRPNEASFISLQTYHNKVSHLNVKQVLKSVLKVSGCWYGFRIYLSTIKYPTTFFPFVSCYSHSYMFIRYKKMSACVQYK